MRNAGCMILSWSLDLATGDSISLECVCAFMNEAPLHWARQTSCNWVCLPRRAGQQQRDRPGQAGNKLERALQGQRGGQALLVSWTLLSHSSPSPPTPSPLTSQGKCHSPRMIVSGSWSIAANKLKIVSCHPSPHLSPVPIRESKWNGDKKESLGEVPNTLKF